MRKKRSKLYAMHRASAQPTYCTFVHTINATGWSTGWLIQCLFGFWLEFISCHLAMCAVNEKSTHLPIWQETLWAPKWLSISQCICATKILFYMSRVEYVEFHSIHNFTHETQHHYFGVKEKNGTQLNQVQ